MAWIIGFGLALAPLLFAGCAPRPLGPPFVLAEAPPEHRGRLYIYRADERNSYATLRVTLDGREIGTFRDGEYETLLVSAGSHRLRAGLRSAAFVAWGWNDQQIRIAPGETVYIKLSARLAERAQPIGRDLEIAGRGSGAVSENVFIQPEGEEAARTALQTTTRRVP